MCGIYGSSSLDKFNKLHDINITRGSFATSHVLIDINDNVSITKNKGNVRYDDYKDTDIISTSKIKLYLGHTQAPTGCVRNFSPDTSHPFTTGEWIVAHNGIINNYKSIISKYIPQHKCEVDSSIIPVLLDKICNDTIIRDEHNDEYISTSHENIIKHVLGLLTGIYAVFIYNTTTNILYIARSGSTLFYNDTTLYYNDNELCFSSVPCDKLSILPEHVLHKLEGNNLIPIIELKNTSSFITF